MEKTTYELMTHFGVTLTKIKSNLLARNTRSVSSPVWLAYNCAASKLCLPEWTLGHYFIWYIFRGKYHHSASLCIWKMLHIHDGTAHSARVYTFKWGFHGNHFNFHCCDLPAAGCWEKLSREMISWKHLKLWIHCKACRVQGWLQVTLGDAGNHWFRCRRGSLREIGHNISSESSTEQQCKGIQGWIVLFLYNHKHMYMLSQSNTLELTCTECQTQYLETVWQTGREGSCLGNFTSELLAVIEKTLRYHTTSERSLFFSWFIPRGFPQWARCASLAPLQMQKEAKLSTKLVVRVPPCPPPPRETHAEQTQIL